MLKVTTAAASKDEQETVRCRTSACVYIRTYTHTYLLLCSSLSLASTVEGRGSAGCGLDGWRCSLASCNASSMRDLISAETHGHDVRCDMQHGHTHTHVHSHAHASHTARKHKWSQLTDVSLLNWYSWLFLIKFS